MFKKLMDAFKKNKLKNKEEEGVREKEELKNSIKLKEEDIDRLEASVQENRKVR